MKAYLIRVVDQGGKLHRYTQLASSSASAGTLAFDRFGQVRALSVLSVQNQSRQAARGHA
jgi:hypothetical protein